MKKKAKSIAILLVFLIGLDWIANNAISVYKQLPKPDENGESGQQVQRGCG